MKIQTGRKAGAGVELQRFLFAISFLVLFAHGDRSWAQPCNFTPTAEADVAETLDNRPVIVDVLANDSDADGDLLSVSVVGSTCSGQVSLDGQQTLTYQPVLGQAESCTISYQIDDGAGGTAPAVVNVTVTAESAACSPPASGDWIVVASCTFQGTATAPGNVVVQNNATLTIASGASLNLNFTTRNLMVKLGSGVLIKVGGKIH